uniref:Uncharacterized protein n=1 Tax=Suricata suricatta TaxID=37032 RepID=A0A673T0X7_SURSU
SHSSQDPVVWGQNCSQIHHGDEGQVSTPRFLVNRTHIQLGVLGGDGVNGEDVQHRQLREEHLGGRRDLLLGLPQNFIVDGHRVQGPAFVGAGHFLPHRCEEALKKRKKIWRCLGAVRSGNKKEEA